MTQPHSTIQTPYSIRAANLSDFDHIYYIFCNVLDAGTTYSYTPDEMTPDCSLAYWMSAPGTHCYVADIDGEVVGMAALRPNRTGRAKHVANASIIVEEKYRGRGIARELCLTVLKKAKQLGYASMQFNFVVSTNERAVDLWKKMGFETIGTMPKGFNHAQHGFVDVFIMHRWLDDVDVSGFEL